MGDNIEALYEKYNILSDARDKVSERSTEYLESMEGVRGNENEKMLTAQIISKFFKHFPQYQERALNAMFDLCEDDEPKIRATAMRYLVTICKDCKEHIGKITDILAQMMQMEEERDFTTASWCLLQLYKEDAANVLKTIFLHIQSLSTSKTREKCIDLVFKKMLRSSSPTQEIEDIVVEEAKRILQNEPSSEEIEPVFGVLSQTKYGKTPLGQQELVELISETVDFSKEFDLTDVNNLSRLIVCTNHALQFFSPKCESNKFVQFYCDQILPQWSKLESVTTSELLRMELLKQLAELSSHCGKLENPSLHVVQIFDKVKLYMPQPPEDADLNKMPNFEFSYVECLLFAFHKLARQCPDFLTHDPEVLKDFRIRLSYFSRGVQGCYKAIKTSNEKSKDSALDARSKIAPVMLNNLNNLIRDLFYQPPVYKCNVQLSFKTKVQTSKGKKESSSSSGATGSSSTGSSSPNKRHVPITFENGGSSSSRPKYNRSRSGGDNVKLYTPPSGKFSNNFQNYDRGGRNNRSRGGGGGRGGGRGRGRNWRN